MSNSRSDIESDKLYSSGPRRGDDARRLSRGEISGDDVNWAEDSLKYYVISKGYVIDQILKNSKNSKDCKNSQKRKRSPTQFVKTFKHQDKNLYVR